MIISIFSEDVNPIYQFKYLELSQDKSAKVCKKERLAILSPAAVFEKSHSMHLMQYV